MLSCHSKTFLTFDNPLTNDTCHVRLYNRERHQAYHNYTLLLTAQALFVMTPLIYMLVPVEWLTIALLAFVLLATVYIVTYSGIQLIVGTLLSVLIIITLLADITAEGKAFAIIGNLGSMLYFIYAGILLAKQIAESRWIDVNILMAAVAGYVFLGMVGAHVINMISILDPEAFTDPMADNYTSIYFSFVTITTLGYGDISPVTAAARACSIFLAVCGQLYLTIIIAVIIGRLLGENFEDE